MVLRQFFYTESIQLIHASNRIRALWAGDGIQWKNTHLVCARSCVGLIPIPQFYQFVVPKN